MSDEALGRGAVYTETVVWSPPEAFANDAPYQLAIIALASGRRVTGRIIGNPGEWARIGDQVEFVEYRHGTPYFRKSS